MKKNYSIFFMFLYFIIFGFVVKAQAVVNSANPVEISAEESLQWDRKNKTYTANKNVVVKQGLMKIESDKLVAYYSDTKGVTDITTLEAISNVIITSPPYVAYGDKAIYNVKSGNAVLTGKKIVVLTDKDIMKADKKIEFYSSENKLVATGNPIINHEQDIIKAKKMTAFFKKDKNGKLQAEKIIAEGGVSIKTIKELATGDRAVYNILSQKATLIGHVRVTQGKNWLEGNRANINLVTGHSELLADKNSKIKTRVKGVFYPVNNKNKKEK